MSLKVSSRFSAVLLAGGKSTRMGTDKALLEIEGETLWQRQLRLLRSLEPHELFFAGGETLEPLGCVRIADAKPECGPLGGLTSALGRCSAPLLFALAVDLPRLTSDYLRGLLAASSETQGVVPRGQPLAAVYPRVVLPLAQDYLARGNYSMQRFAADCAERGLVRQIEISAEDEPLFLNLNTPHDLAAVRSHD